MKEVYPIFKEATWVGDGFRYYFDVPEKADSFELGYKGRSWPLKVKLFDPAGRQVACDAWVGSNEPSCPMHWLGASAADLGGGGSRGWSFAVSGNGHKPGRDTRPARRSSSRWCRREELGGVPVTYV